MKLNLLIVLLTIVCAVVWTVFFVGVATSVKDELKQTYPHYVPTSRVDNLQVTLTEKDLQPAEGI